MILGEGPVVRMVSIFPMFVLGGGLAGHKSAEDGQIPLSP